MKRIGLTLAIGIFALIAFSGCASTKTENGVTIEKKRSVNPLHYIPYL